MRRLVLHLLLLFGTLPLATQAENYTLNDEDWKNDPNMDEPWLGEMAKTGRCPVYLTYPDNRANIEKEKAPCQYWCHYVQQAAPHCWGVCDLYMAFRATRQCFTLLIVYSAIMRLTSTLRTKSPVHTIRYFETRTAALGFPGGAFATVPPAGWQTKLPTS